MSEFRIDVLDTSGAVVGDGPLVNVLALANTRSLDRIGEAAFSLPAADPRGALIQAGRQFDIYDRVDGYLGRYTYRGKTIKGTALEVRVYDQLRELTHYSVGFRRVYTAQAVDVVVADLLTVAGWTGAIDSGIGTTSVTYEGESVLAAVDVLRDRWGKHYRLGTPGVLEFGAFGTDSGVRLTNLSGQVQADISGRSEVAIVESIALVDEADEVVNHVVPLGAGQGVSQLTIQTATAGSYTVQTGTNQDGSSYYYLEDATSVGAYGRRPRVLTMPNIRPITNSDANTVYAANALKIAAEAYLARHLVPKVTYDVSVVGLRANISPGDTVRLVYRGIVDGYTYIDIDESFYVLDIRNERQASGARGATLTISTTAERRTADTDIIADVVNDVRALKVHVPITLAYSPVGPYTQRIDSTHDAEFTVRIGDEVTALNYAKLRFKTAPLRSSTTAAASGGGSTATAVSNTHTHSITADGGHTHSTTIGSGGAHTHAIVNSTGFPAGTSTPWPDSHYHNVNFATGSESHTHSATTSSSTTHDHTIGASGGHTHDVTIPAHTHSLTYGLYEDTSYPQTISIEVDGSAVAGGPWATGGAVSVEEEIDITSLLTAGTLRQNHSIVFACTSGRGEIEFECDMLVSIQAIAVS